MKFFKKKKSDKNPLQIDIQDRKLNPNDSFINSSIQKKPLNDVIILKPSISNNKPDIDLKHSPILLMPKPRRLITPTRAILSRFDRDKTQVEDEEEEEGNETKDNLENNNTQDLKYPQEISPVLLPAAHEVSPQVKNSYLKLPQQVKPIPSLSTITSDESSHLYLSAQGSIIDSTEDHRLPRTTEYSSSPTQPVQNNSSHPVPQPDTLSHPEKKPYPQQTLPVPSTSLSSFIHPQPTDESSMIKPTLPQKPSEYYQHQQRLILDHQQKQQKIIQQQQKKHQLQLEEQQQIIQDHQQKQKENQELKQHLQHLLEQEKKLKQNLLDQEQKLKQQQLQQGQLLLEQKKQQFSQQEFTLKELKNQIQLMEQQRLKDKEEWFKKEQELLNFREQMMESLIETKGQLSNVLRNREEDKAIHQQQLQQQLQQKVSEMAIDIQQLPIPLSEFDESQKEYLPEQRPKSNGYHHYQSGYYNDYGPDPEQTDPTDSFIDPVVKRKVNKSKSEEYLRYHSRSSSRSSHYYPPHEERQGHYSENYRNGTSSRNTMKEEGMGRRSVSRHSSSGSNKSNYHYPSPSITLVATPHQYHRRSRAKSFDYKSNEEQPQMMMKANHDLMSASSFTDEAIVQAQQRVYGRIRRSRSVGKELRSPSRNSSVYSGYYKNENKYKDDRYDEFYANDQYEGYYDDGRYDNFYDNDQPNNYIENAPPYKQSSSRYNSSMSYYMQQPKQHQYGPIYSSPGYYYSRQSSIGSSKQPQSHRHNMMYSSKEPPRHYYGYN